MARKRRFRSRGRFTKLRRRRGGFRTKRLRKFVKRVVKRMQETKYRTANADATVDAFTGYVTSIVPTFPQGVDKYNRIGNRISWKYLQFRLSLLFTRAQGTASAVLVRLIMFQTRTAYQPPTGNSTTNIWPYLFDTAPGIVSSIKNQNVRILMDKTRWFGLQDYADLTQEVPFWYIKKKIPIRNNVNFISSAELVPNETKDQIYFAIITNRIAATVVNVNYVWQSRFSFYDL